jgi:hypothetical protein
MHTYIHVLIKLGLPPRWRTGPGEDLVFPLGIQKAQETSIKNFSLGLWIPHWMIWDPNGVI